MNKITRIGLDIAKNVFVLHAVNEHGKTVKRQTLSRAKVLPFFASIEPVTVHRGLTFSTVLPGLRTARE